MKKRIAAAVLMAAAILLAGCSESKGTDQQEATVEITQEQAVKEMSESMRQEINLNGNWKYCKGASADFFSEEYDDSSWTWVNLPHNTSLYTAENKNSYEGISCYRKIFSIDEECAGKRIILNFEGVMQSSSVYLNGEKIAENHDGYTPFSVDISDKVRTGDNLLAVIADSSPDPEYTPGKQNPDFQYFGGIYRNVTLDITDNIYIGNAIEDGVAAGGGVFLTSPSVSRESADIRAKTYVHNDSSNAQEITLRTEVIYKGETVADGEASALIESGSAYTFDETLTLSEPKLWHPYSPELYTVKSTVTADGKAVDTVETSYGVRSVEWTHDGLFINGEEFKAQGANLHSDIFVLGNAIPDNEVYEEIKRFKENGFDFIRMSHYPHSDAYYDACDKYGVLVLECMSGWQNFNNSDTFKESTYDELRTMIRNSRNHPCIIAWETSLNESNYTEEWAAEAQKIAHEEYPTDGISRMWTAGWKTDCFDVGLGAAQHGIRNDADKSKKGVIISEYGDWDYGGSSSTSRRARELGDNAMLTQAANHIESAILTRNEEWYGADGLWAYGDYAGFDSGMNYCGVTDMYRIDKYSAYFFRSQRHADVDLSDYGIESGAMVFIANSLTDASPTDVIIFSNCDEVELIADGVSLGKQTPDKEYYGPNSKGMLSTENLPHAPITFAGANNNASELKAVGYINGTAVCEHTVKSPETADKIELMAESEAPIKANGSDVRLVWVKIVDKNGTVTVNDDKYVTFTAENGYVIGYESVNTKGGQIGVWVRANASENDGKILLTASAEGLSDGVIEIPFVGCEYAADCNMAVNEYAGSAEEKVLIVQRGKNLASGKTAYASTENKGQEFASLALDGSDSTWWCADNSQPAPHWWSVDMGRTVEFSEIVIKFEERTSTVYKFILQGSDDNENWTDIADYSTNNEPNGETVITAGGAYRYFRVYDISASGGMWPTIAEFEVYAENGTLSDRAREKAAYSSSCADGCTAENGNNGEPSTFWYPDSTDGNAWWYVDTGAVYDFERIEIGWNNNEIHRFIIELSDDGESWTTALDMSDNSKAESQTVENISGSGRYVRITFAENNGCGFNMFYAYGK